MDFNTNQTLTIDILGTSFIWLQINSPITFSQGCGWNIACRRILLIEPVGTTFSGILFEIQTVSLKKVRLKMSSEKCRPFRLGLNVSSSLLFNKCHSCAPGKCRRNIIFRITTATGASSTLYQINDVKHWWTTRTYKMELCSCTSATNTHIMFQWPTELPRTVYLLICPWPPFRHSPFSSVFSWMKSFVFLFKFHWCLFLRFQLTISEHWSR